MFFKGFANAPFLHIPRDKRYVGALVYHIIHEMVLEVKPDFLKLDFEIAVDYAK